MDRLKKCELALEKGFVYCELTGSVFGVKGNVIKKKSNGYVALTIWHNKKRLYLYAHQFAWYFLNKEIVPIIDHKNGVKTDNRACNLRSVTKQINALNTNSSGAYLDKRTCTYESKVMINGKSVYLGKFKLKKDAQLAHKNFKINYINTKIVKL